MYRIPFPRPAVLALLLLAAATPGWAWQQVPGAAASPPVEEAAYVPRTGDAWIDRHLADINLYAARYPQAFADELGRYYSVPRAYVEAMLQQPSWEAGDIVLACALAQTVGQPCRAVVREWSRDHADGWEGVAARLQPPPGPAQYREIRARIKQSYARWARPLPD